MTVPVASADATVPASSPVSGEQQRSDPLPQRIQIFLNESDREQMEAEGREREAAAQAGKPVVPPPPVPQPSNRPASPASAAPALSPTEAEQKARQAASTPEAIDVSANSVASSRDIVPAVAPPVDIVPPEPQLSQCLSDGADDEFGRILNRFAYCQEQTLIAEYIIRINNFPDVKLGETEFRYETFVQGDERDRRVRVFARVQADSVQYRWRTEFWNLFVAPFVPLTMIAECHETFLSCQATRGPVTFPFVTWDNNDREWFYWDVLSPTSAGTERDLIAYAHWYLDLETRWGRASADFETERRQIRCDSATYFNRGTAKYPEACIFSEAIPHLTYSTEDFEVRAVALHIEQAQTNPNSTYPLLVPQGFPPPRDKRIPGRYVPDDPNAPGLHRIREAVDPEYRANGQHKDAACYGTGPLADEYLDLGLPEPPDTESEECDEYPFATTLEGAAHPEWDFSVRAVPDFQNSAAGGRLGAYLTDDRILSWDPTLPLEANDRFYVQIT